MPTDLVTFADFLQAAVQIVTDFGLMPVILSGAVIGLGAQLFRRFRSASR